MSTVIMMFILPLGILTYWWDRRNYAQNIEVFRSFVIQTAQTTMSPEEKARRIDEMFYQNGYRRVVATSKELVVEKKHFNIGLLLIVFGALTYIGLALYLLYYRFGLKPRRLRIDLETMRLYEKSDR